MSENTNELPIRLGVIGLAAGIAILLGLWIDDVDFLALMIPLFPFVAFPAALIGGWLFKGSPMWKMAMKEGGVIVLFSLMVAFALSVVVAVEYIGDVHGHAGGIALDTTWLPFDEVVDDGAGGQALAPATDDGIEVGVYLDHVSVLLTVMASFLCVLICWFSIGYMNTDPINEDRLHRFYGAFTLFATGMLGMVLADSFLFLFIFWEIMGLCSYLLIGFYWERKSAAYAAKKAFLTTRVGDVFLMVGLVILYNLYGTTSFAHVFHEIEANHAVNITWLRWALVFLFVGAVGKSAQFPLHVWLPDAMEGPTPVSALIHAATMVNAGLYLVARMFPFFDVDPSNLLHGELVWIAVLIAWIGGITAVMAALIAFVQTDIKKVLAYSTMSQLAYIFTGLGAALWLANEGHHHHALIAFGASLMHLFNHALAKGMLFMASGSVIHEMHHAEAHLAHADGEADHDHGHHDHLDPQDMRNMGGLASRMPITSFAMLVGSASIIGLPFIGGFYSKEGIIHAAWEAALEGGSGAAILVPAILVLLTAGLTGFYMSRMWFMTFAGKPKTEVAAHVEEQTPWIPMPLITLSVLSLMGIVFAAFEMVAWIGEGHAFKWYPKEAIYWLIPKNELTFIGWFAVLLSTVLGPLWAMKLYGGAVEWNEGGSALRRGAEWVPKRLTSFSAGFARKNTFDNTAMASGGLAVALQNRLYFDGWYDAFCSKVIVGIARSSRWVDERGVDGVIKGIESGSQAGSTWLRRLTSGRARDYLVFVAVGSVGIFLLLLQEVA